MPLLNKAPFKPLVPAVVEQGAEHFYVAVSGEVMRSYDDYLTRLKFYRDRNWSCAYTLKSGLTYEEALQDEERISALLLKFPRDLLPSCLMAVQHSTKGTEELVAQMYELHKPAPRTGKENGSVQPSPSADTATVTATYPATATNIASSKKPPVTKPLFRRWLVEVAERKGLVWVVKPELAAKFGLPADIPEALTEATKGVASPTSVQVKAPLAKVGAKPGVGGESGTKTNKQAQKLEHPPRSLEEEEKCLRHNTAKYSVFTQLKAAGAEGLSLDHMIEVATKLEPKQDWVENARKNMYHTLFRDAAFCRVASVPTIKYALRAMAGVVPLVGEGTAVEGAAAKAPKAQEQPRSIEEEEKRMRPNTAKQCVFTQLKAAGPEGLTLDELMEGVAELEPKPEWAENVKRNSYQILSHDPTFCKVAVDPKIKYALRALPGVAPLSEEDAKVAKTAKTASAAADREAKKAANAAADKEAKKGLDQPHTVEDEEKRMRPNSTKYFVFTQLKAAGVEGLSVDELLEGVAKLEPKPEWAENARRNTNQILSHDPIFCKVAVDPKNKYALRVLPGVVPLTEEDAKVAKTAKTAGADADREAKKAARAAADKEVKTGQEQPRSVEDEEKRLRPNTAKQCVFTQLKAAGAEGLSLDELVEGCDHLEAKPEWAENPRRNMNHVLSHDPTFCKVAADPKTKYALRALPGVVPLSEEDAKAIKAAKAAMTAGAAAAREAKKAASAAADNEAKATASAAAKSAAEALSPAPPVMRGPVDPMEEATAMLARSRANMGKCEKAVVQSREAVEEKSKALEELRAVKSSPAPSPGPSKLGSPKSLGSPTAAGLLAAAATMFELPAEIRDFSGNRDDRKELMAWKKKKDDEVKKLERKKEVWVAEQRQKRSKAAAAAAAATGAAATSEVKSRDSLGLRLQNGGLELDDLKRRYACAVKSASDAEKAVERDQQRVQLLKEKAGREAARVFEREDRERRRAEALAEKERAKRYPMDDLELMEELKGKAAEAGSATAVDVLPAELMQSLLLSPDASESLASSMYFADTLSHFGKALEVHKGTMSCADLENMLQLATSQSEPEVMLELAGPSASSINTPAAATSMLWSLYEKLIKVALEDLEEGGGGGGRLQERWENVLHTCTWPEVLRRYIISRAGSSGNASMTMVPVPVAVAASKLGSCEVAALQRSDHCQLLTFLMDELLDSEDLRGLLAERMEDAAGAATEIRAEIAEGKRKLKEVVDAEKEAKKKKREDKLAAAQARLIAEKEAADAGAPLPSAPPHVDANDSDDSDTEEEPPTFELPPQMVVFTGPEDDRKALLVWRQEVQNETKRLEKEKARWQAAARQRQKDREARHREKQREAERKAKDRKVLEDAVAASQEALEKELEKLAQRRAPLGLDRYHRRYWWGVAGQHSVLLIEDADGRWAALNEITQVDRLMAGLDTRGVRELELKRALDKAYLDMSTAMRKAAQLREATMLKKEGADGGKAEKVKGLIPPEREQPRRQGRFEGSMADAKKPKVEKKVEEVKEKASAREPAPSELILTHAVECMENMASLASAAKVACPEAGWKAWKAKVAVLPAQLSEGRDQAECIADARSALLELEQLLVKGTGEEELLNRNPDGENEASEGSEEDEAEEKEGTEEGGDGDVEMKDAEDEGDRDADMAEQGTSEEAGAGSKRKKGKLERRAAGNADSNDEEDEDPALLSALKKRRMASHQSQSKAHTIWDVLADDAKEEVYESDDEDLGEEASKVSKKRASLCLWRTKSERDSWLNCTAKAATTSRLAYCSSVLMNLARTPLVKLQKTSSKKKAAHK